MAASCRPRHIVRSETEDDRALSRVARDKACEAHAGLGLVPDSTSTGYSGCRPSPSAKPPLSSSPSYATSPFPPSRSDTFAELIFARACLRASKIKSSDGSRFDETLIVASGGSELHASLQNTTSLATFSAAWNHG